MTVMLISLGNEFRRDDGVAAELCRSLPDSIMRQIKYLDFGIHAEQIPFFIEDADEAIIVDATFAPQEVGTLKVLKRNQLAFSWSNATHGFSWFHTLELGRLKTELTFVLVPVCDKGWGKGLSDDVTQVKSKLETSLAEVCQNVIAHEKGNYCNENRSRN